MEAQTTIEKAVDVLFHLHGEPAARGVTDIGRALGMPKSSAHRVLAALGRRGLVEKDERGRYRPGIGLIALGLGALDREPVVGGFESQAAGCVGHSDAVVHATLALLVEHEVGVLDLGEIRHRHVNVLAVGRAPLELVLTGELVTEPCARDEVGRDLLEHVEVAIE